MTNLIGTDVSFWQDDPQTPEGIDFRKMRENAGYTIIRAGQNLWADREFKVNWREAKLAGIPRGSYWFYDSRADPKKQAELWASLFNGDFGELPLWADFEDNYGGSFKGWRNWKVFIESLKELMPGKEIGVYTAYYYWLSNTVSVGIPAAELNYFKQYPLWIANYGTNSPLVPKPWTDWTFWQYTDKGNGKIYGVESGNIDLNYFNGDLAAFNARFNLTSTPLPNPDSKLYRVTASSLVVREGPGLDFKQIGGVFFNDTVEELEANADRTWLKIRNSNGSMIGWCFSGYLQKITGTTPIPEPEPEPEPPVITKPRHRVTASSGLLVREGPGTNFKQIGLLQFNEIVEEIGANAGRTWININKLDGSLTGWSSASFLQQVSAPAPEPTPEPEPEPEPEPTPEPPPGSDDKVLHRVTAEAGLIMRNGPGLSYTQIGSLTLNEFVEEVGALADRSWLKVSKLDGSMTGWCFAAYLKLVKEPAPEPPPTPTPGTEDKNWYRVTAEGLKLREGPGLDYEAIGMVMQGDLVERIAANSDGTWFKIHNVDNTLTGWSSSEYLQSVSVPIQEEPPPAATVPEYVDKNWYRVNTATLNIRAAPSTSATILGTILKNDTVPGLDDTSDSNWIQIQRLDGVTGWCDKRYLVLAENTRPRNIRQSLYPGVVYIGQTLTSPRLIVAHTMIIDLQVTKLEFLITPPSNFGNILCARTTSQFLEEFKLHVAINGGYYRYLDETFNPATYCPSGGTPVRVTDFAASRGKIYASQKTMQPTIYIKRRNQVSFNTEDGATFNAISGDRMVVENSRMVKNLADAAPNPRTAVGLGKNARWLILMVVDGRQPGYSEGVTLPELAELLIAQGAVQAANMDGGGSSTMVIRGVDGKARVVNSPIDANKPRKERAVANHLGLFVMP
jgi:GH25 family lysozyme M1 (1,4-beta-N-acetylmuramidase)/uncharacterized protein YraI